MDILSHGLWGGISFGRKNKKDFCLAFIFGIMPDLLSFGILTLATIFGWSVRPDWGGHPVDAAIPAYVHALYNITHSLIIFLILFLIVYLLNKKPFWPILAWGLHILMDIPTHTIEFFATPFMWPLSSVRVNGISWGHPIIMIPDIVLLVILYVWFFGFKKGWKK